MCKFYKHISFQNIDLITNKLINFIKDLHEIKTSTYKLDHQQLIETVPELKSQLDEYGFSSIGVARILVTAPNSTLRLHNDGNDENPKYLALNWPLLNCNNTIMRWYNADISVKNYVEEGYGVFDLYDIFSATKLAETEIISPTLVNIQCPHDVDNPLDSSRFMLSIRFDVEPFDIYESL